MAAGSILEETKDVGETLAFTDAAERQVGNQYCPIDGSLYTGDILKNKRHGQG